jgi:Cof subfamily protein (haloacid dehalogenase superfamily)
VNKYRLVVFDIDGTLQNSRHEISPYTEEVIQRLQARGILVSICTGKTLPAVKSPAEKLNIQIPIIMSNGSILQYANGQIVHASFFTEETARTIITLVSACDADISLFTPEAIYVRKITESVRAMMGFGAPHPQEITSWDSLHTELGRVIKFVMMNMGGAPALAPVADALKSHLDGQVSYFPTMPYMLEVLPQGENKASGLRRLAEHLKIQPSEIIAIGDGDNDAVMLDLAGLGVAVANGTPICKASADLLIDSNDEEGPARFLNGLMKAAQI